MTPQAPIPCPAFVCPADNDLYRVVADAAGGPPPRHDHFSEAVDAADPQAGLLLLADGYPETPTPVDPALLTRAAERGLRLYLEYPAAVPGLRLGPPRAAGHERAVVADGFFGEKLPAARILAVGGLHLQDVDLATTHAPTHAAVTAHLVAARVAGFDSAVYGLPARTAPLLFEIGPSPLLVATTMLSRIVTGRYAPTDAWATLWQTLLAWVCPGCQLGLAWAPLVAPTFAPAQALPVDAEAEALRRGVAWFHGSGLLVHPQREAELVPYLETGRMPQPDTADPGDGSAGILEGQMSVLQPDGSQEVSVIRRCDCVCEAAMALALSGQSEVAGKLLDFVFFDSEARGGGRGDPAHPAYGHVAWGVSTPAWLKANYGDDNARVLLSTAAAAATLGDTRWDEAMALCLLANLRTTGVHGFRPGRIDYEALEERGWEACFRDDLVLLHPHYECYLWACFLWAYEHSGDELFYRRARAAIARLVEAGPGGWRWTNGLAQERARMLLPLAWLVRVADTEEHRRWLRDIAAGLLALQDDCGAIAEELGAPELGSYPPPLTNEAYGEHEASLIQANGDPVADLLYTTNFAFLGLHEAAAATGDADLAAAADRLAGFLCRIQTRSVRRPELDGAWFRAFDFGRWEPWGSNADVGWGAWSVESGWTQGWITAVLALRQQRTCLWDLTAGSGVGATLRQHREDMLPAALVADVEAQANRGGSRWQD